MTGSEQSINGRVDFPRHRTFHVVGGNLSVAVQFQVPEPTSEWGWGADLAISGNRAGPCGVARDSPKIMRWLLGDSKDTSAS